MVLAFAVTIKVLENKHFLANYNINNIIEINMFKFNVLHKCGDSINRYLLW